MKELLIGMGLGFVVGAVACKICKPVQDTIDKGQEIIEDITDEVKAQTKNKNKAE